MPAERHSGADEALYKKKKLWRYYQKEGQSCPQEAPVGELWRVFEFPGYLGQENPCGSISDCP